MKKITALFLSLSVFAVGQSFAQDEETERVRFGLKAGVNLANVKTKPSDETSTRSLPGINGGLFPLYP